MEEELDSTTGKVTRFMVVDGHGLIYRAYHAFPGLTAPDGRLVNAVYGFTRILHTAISEYEPEFIAIAFDHKGPTLRAQEYTAYKAHRAPMPEELKHQIQIVKDVVSALNIPQFELEGYEADDLIGTVTRLSVLESSCQVHNLVVTGDKDLLQLVDETTHVWIPARNKFGGNIEYGAQEVVEKMGVTPTQVVDLKALMGDTSDNIPGVKGIGAKTAVTLVTTFGSLASVYERVSYLQADPTQKDPVIKGAVLQNLIQDKENAFLSQKLAKIDRIVPIKFTLEPCRVSDYDKEQTVKLFEELDFKSLVPLLPDDTFESGVQDALF
jgi:DNA polymerase-1